MKFKNITTAQISLSLTIVMVLVGFLHIAFYYWISSGLQKVSWIGVLLLSMIFLCITYFSSKYILEKFVFRKIKLIYKLIRDSKTSMEGQDVDLEAVNDEVSNWANKKEEEIQALKSLEEYRRNFVGNISHELKTPIFAVQGFLHTLLDGGMYDEKINKLYLEKAVNNTNRLQFIVEDLDTIHKMESGGIIFKQSKFNIRDIADEVFSDLELVAKNAAISLIFKEGASRGFNVSADPDAIRQVLTNLITNSIKYSNPGGQTKLSFYDMDDEQILIEVSDKGIGIDNKHLKHLFDRFYRVDPGRSRSQGGSGLGLSIVKHIIEAHNQKVYVRSTVGQGTTFSFTLHKA